MHFHLVATQGGDERRVRERVTGTVNVVSNATYSYKLHFATGQAIRWITVLAPNLARIGFS